MSLPKKLLLDTLYDELHSLSNSSIAISKYDEAAFKERAISQEQHYHIVQALTGIREAHKHIQNAITDIESEDTE